MLRLQQVIEFAIGLNLLIPAVPLLAGCAISYANKSCSVTGGTYNNPTVQ
jgi:hypothetical protein